jgi:2-polyprenyl-6-methoxyphenol hydroxylase-like FAD-dependent oxidoreductase
MFSLRKQIIRGSTTNTLKTLASRSPQSRLLALTSQLYPPLSPNYTNKRLSTNMSTQKPILISGAGLSSLLLAQSLLRSKIPFQIYERDASFSFRAQGYRLRLSSEGLDAVESVLGPEDFEKFYEICGKTGGGGFGAIDAHSGEIIPMPEAKKMEEEKKKKEEAEREAREKAENELKERLEDGGKEEVAVEVLTSREGKIIGISRGEMRKFFAQNCEPYIKWSHRVTGYELTPTGVVAIFADGTKSIEGSLLVGGEGINSLVAKQVSKGKLKVYDTGARGIHGSSPTTAFKQLGEGVWRMIDNSNPLGTISVITNVRAGDMDDPTLQFGWAIGAQPGVIEAPNDNSLLVGAPAANIAKELTKNWHPKLKPLFDEMDVEEAAFWKITCSTPTGIPEWETDERVTLIGDAVHSMTPAGGNGANTAVRDSALLGRLLGEKGGWEKGVTKEYEKEMRGYASDAVKMSYGLGKMQLGFVIDENSKTI